MGRRFFDQPRYQLPQFLPGPEMRHELAGHGHGVPRFGISAATRWAVVPRSSNKAHLESISIFASTNKDAAAMGGDDGLRNGQPQTCTFA